MIGQLQNQINTLKTELAQLQSNYDYLFESYTELEERLARLEHQHTVTKTIDIERGSEDDK